MGRERIKMLGGAEVGCMWRLSSREPTHFIIGQKEENDMKWDDIQKCVFAKILSSKITMHLNISMAPDIDR